MEREVIIQNCFNKFEEGYLNIKDVDLKDVGNCLEMTGKFLMALTEQEKIQHKAFIDKVMSDLKENCLIDETHCFIPRIKYYGEDEPQDSKPNRWERFNSVWWRTDVSYSQFTYLIQGLEAINETYLLNKGLNYIDRYDFEIKRINGEPAQNGNFNLFFLPNVQLRKYYLKILTSEKHNFFEFVWFNIMQYITWSLESDNGLNSCLIYYSILMNDIDKYRNALNNVIFDFTKRWLAEYFSATSTVVDFKADIHFLLMDKIYNELYKL